MGPDVNVELLTSSGREPYLDKFRGAIETAERFAIVTSFATSDGLALLEPAMRACLKGGGMGTIVLALDRQHFNAADVFCKLAAMMSEFGEKKLHVCLVPEGAGLLHAKAPNRFADSAITNAPKTRYVSAPSSVALRRPTHFGLTTRRFPFAALRRHASR
jgi:HKD family nuclease